MKKLIKRHFLLYSLFIITNVVVSILEPQVIAQTLCCSNTIQLSEQANGPLTKITSARKLFQEAYENRYTWDSQFPGYTAVVQYKQGREVKEGHVRVNRDMTVEVTGIEDKDVLQAVKDSLGMNVTHRQRLPFEVAHKNSTFRLGSTDSTGAVEIFEEGFDKRRCIMEV